MALPAKGSRDPSLPHIRTKLPGPAASKVLEQDRQFISPSYTRPYPLVARKGRGAIIEDVDGNRFLDFSAGIAVVATGHCHPKVVRAIQKQAAELIHMSGTDFYYPSLARLAQKLAEITPGNAPKRVYFGNSGTEAIEAAMKLARIYTGRDKFIAFTNAFHGRTLGALSLTASRPVQRRGFGPLVPGVVHIPYANCYRCAYNLKPEDCGMHCARVIEEQLFQTLLPSDEVAAIFVEPIQGEGGLIVPPPEFLRELRRICDKYGILLVADEVQCGFGRTGKMWACEHSQVVPDIICLAKGIASGMPLSATVSRADIMNWPPGAHASTFGGNPVSIAASLATIELLEEKLVVQAERLGQYLLQRLRDWPDRHALVGDIRGQGLMVGIELVLDRQSKQYATPQRDRLVQAAFEKGLLVLGCGVSTIRLVPPLTVSQKQIDFAVDVLDRCLTKIESDSAPKSARSQNQRK
ncbi:MAG: 4-aminobutyrate aminotransferase [Acidobacteria bacterium RIFCSPLOWO2_02_FULL_59_13]|nr:MAG: 4-aminobutyrate aminotransferase [Acidobacteria bacterium RIFCSPLOWO2_02_FULL_59_13]